MSFNLKDWKKQYKIKIKNDKYLSLTKDKCLEIAILSESEPEFKKRNHIAYNKSIENGWIIYIITEIKKINPSLIWSTKEVYKNIALKYENRRDFRKYNKGLYELARKAGYLEEICSHMDRLINVTGYWSKERCKELSLSCKTKSEFREKYQVAYDRSSKNGWIDEICSHMDAIGNRYKRCIYSYEFPDMSVYVGLTYDLSKRKLKHIQDVNSAVYKYVKMTSMTPVIKQLTEYIDVGEASKIEGTKLNEYRNNGWKILNISKTGSVGSLPYKAFKK